MSGSCSNSANVMSDAAVLMARSYYLTVEITSALRSCAGERVSHANRETFRKRRADYLQAGDEIPGLNGHGYGRETQDID